LPRSPLFMVGKVKLHGTRSELNSVFGLEKVDRWNPIGTSAIESRFRPIRFLGFSKPWKGSSEARNFEVINGLQHVFAKWVERCKKCIACQGRYFERDCHRTSTKFRLGVIRWVHELLKRPSYFEFCRLYFPLTRCS
jgi:hypothetical protein